MEVNSYNSTHRCIAFLLFVCLILYHSVAQATETHIVVRALAKDAMFIGTSMGGAKIIIRDVESGAILAQGFTEGGTGKRSTVMQEPRKRGKPLADPFTAKFEARLDISETTLVTIEALAPHGQRQSMIQARTQVWLIPGGNIIGDGVILEIPGFSVDIIVPQPSERIRLSENPTIKIIANVVMMCGCPITPGGMWDSDGYEITGIVKHNGIKIDSIPLVYGNKANTFEGTLKPRQPGTYEIQVYAFDPQTGNAGVDTVIFKTQ